MPKYLCCSSTTTTSPTFHLISHIVLQTQFQWLVMFNIENTTTVCVCVCGCNNVKMEKEKKMKSAHEKIAHTCLFVECTSFSLNNYNEQPFWIGNRLCVILLENSQTTLLSMWWQQTRICVNVRAKMNIFQLFERFNFSTEKNWEKKAHMEKLMHVSKKRSTECVVNTTVEREKKKTLVDSINGRCRCCTWNERSIKAKF